MGKWAGPSIDDFSIGNKEITTLFAATEDIVNRAMWGFDKDYIITRSMRLRLIIQWLIGGILR